MKTVQKGNKQIRVADDRLEDMLKVGYVEVDEKTGKPVNVPVKDPDSAALKKENKKLKARVEELEAQVTELKAQVETQGTKG